MNTELKQYKKYKEWVEKVNKAESIRVNMEYKAYHEQQKTLKKEYERKLENYKYFWTKYAERLGKYERKSWFYRLFNESPKRPFYPLPLDFSYRSQMFILPNYEKESWTGFMDWQLKQKHGTR